MQMVKFQQPGKGVNERDDINTAESKIDRK
jgi:hypothetical protein